MAAEDCERHKPWPDPYLLACRQLDIHPRDAIAFEDSWPGIRSAITAGMNCVAVQSDTAVDTTEADLTLLSLEAVVVDPAPGWRRSAGRPVLLPKGRESEPSVRVAYRRNSTATR